MPQITHYKASKHNKDLCSASQITHQYSNQSVSLHQFSSASEFMW